ncbi:MAG: peptidylprolyl isomerase [Elusimicrobia bacterium]|nr:peptidylprolyl isomerase [Elusimicrobiota bacterium]
MKNSSKVVLAALAAALLAPAARAMVAEDVIATVNGKPILLSQYERQLSPVMSEWAQTNPQVLQDPDFVAKLRKSALEQMIDDELLYQEALKKKIAIDSHAVDAGIDEIKRRFQTDPDGNPLSAQQAEQAFQDQLKQDGLTYEQFRQRIKKEVAIRKLVDQEIKSTVVPPDPAAVQAYFDKIKAYIVSGSTLAPAGMDDESAAAFMQIAQQIKSMSAERVRVSRILIRLAPQASPNEKRRALDAINQIREQLETSTETFAEAAQQNSEDPASAAHGGDIGYIVRGMSPPAFEKAAFSLPVGDISKPILTPDGYNIIQVEDHLAATPPQFSDFKDQLTKAMMNLELQKKLERYVKSLKRTAVIERNLPK